MLSVHTSPLDQPGTGDAGGLNVYVTDLSRALARLGARVEIFTRSTASAQPAVVELDRGDPRVRVRHVPAGPFEGLDKSDLPGQLCAFTAGVLRAEASRPAGWYDVVHSHYWLSGQVGWLVADRWDVPLVHTMHTLAKVKNAALAPGDSPEPAGRLIGEGQVVAAADALLASTVQEATDLVDLYDADPATVHVVAPGVDLAVFHPIRPGAGSRDAIRARLHLPADRQVVLFAGRVQALKGPDVLIRALAILAATGRPVPLLVVLGGPSGRPTALRELGALAAVSGISPHVLFRPPVPRAELADWFRAADLVAMPSRSESFGLVAAESQASGTPVVASAVGGLRTVVHDGLTGRLVDSHDPARWADVLADLLADDAGRAALADGAAHAGERLGWDAVAAQVLKVYALADQRRRS